MSALLDICQRFSTRALLARKQLQPIPVNARNPMTITLTPLLSLIAGILILMVPRLLNYIVAIYLIIVGLVGLFGATSFSFN